MLQNRDDLIIVGDVLKAIKLLPKYSFDMVITSPPYYKRRRFNVITRFPDGWVGELGWEPTPKLYAKHLAFIFKRISRKMDKCCPVLLNIDDTKFVENDTRSLSQFGGNYIDVVGLIVREFRKVGLKLNHKFILIKGYYDREADGVVRFDPRYVSPHKFEHMLLFSKSHKCFLGRRFKSDVIPVKLDYVTEKNSHTSRYGASYVDFFIRELTNPGDTVLDPFAGTGTTGVVARRLGRHFILIEANSFYIDKNILKY